MFNPDVRVQLYCDLFFGHICHKNSFFLHKTFSQHGKATEHIISFCPYRFFIEIIYRNHQFS